ncbi:cell division protein FtsK [Lactobacillus apis]|uniref:cell division protein FtsK n=1 Tax=Lactobacillus apis TaxID=303541 RepID=UPI00242E366D|nr:cell division protein FtsK [Lactobacillus apis]
MSYLLTLSKSISIDGYKKINFLVAGARGSGKTFGTLILIAQMASFPRKDTNHLLGTGQLPTQIYCVDFKNSDMAKLAAFLPAGRVATNKEDAIDVVTKYDQLMHDRLDFIKTKDFGATAGSLGMPMYYLIIDEWSATNAAFNQGVTRTDKDMRYKWNSLITDIAMLNRVPGFGLGIISQQISVVNSGLNSSVQEEAGLKLHFGNANMSSYRLTFGNEIQIPEMNLDTGEAYAWIEGQTSSGYVIPFGMPEIDPSKLWKYLKASLSNQDDDRYLYMTTKQ